MNDEKKKKNKKKNTVQSAIRTVILALALIGLLALCVTYALPINVTAVLGMMNDNRAVVASGSEIYVIELPT